MRLAAVEPPENQPKKKKKKKDLFVLLAEDPLKFKVWRRVSGRSDVSDTHRVYLASFLRVFFQVAFVSKR